MGICLSCLTHYNKIYASTATAWPRPVAILKLENRSYNFFKTHSTFVSTWSIERPHVCVCVCVCLRFWDKSLNPISRLQPNSNFCLCSLVTCFHSPALHLQTWVRESIFCRRQDASQEDHLESGGQRMKTSRRLLPACVAAGAFRLPQRHRSSPDSKYRLPRPNNGLPVLHTSSISHTSCLTALPLLVCLDTQQNGVIKR